MGSVGSVNLSNSGQLLRRNGIASLVPRSHQQTVGIATFEAPSSSCTGQAGTFYAVNQVHKRFLSAETKPFSRKRPGGAETPAMASSNMDFNQQAIVAMIQIFKALSPLLESNKGFRWSCSQLDVLSKVAAQHGKDPSNTSILNPFAHGDEALRMMFDVGVKGAYIFSIDRQQERVNVQSPISGTYSYAYDGEYWLSVMDGHDMRGLITRDLLRHCCGCPAF